MAQVTNKWSNNHLLPIFYFFSTANAVVFCPANHKTFRLIIHNIDCIIYKFLMYLLIRQNKIRIICRMIFLLKTKKDNTSPYLGIYIVLNYFQYLFLYLGQIHR